MSKRAHLIVNPTNQINLTIKNRTRGQEINEYQFDLFEKTDLAKKFVSLITKISKNQFSTITKSDRIFLKDIGIIIPKTEVPQNVESDFVLKTELLKYILSAHNEEFKNAYKKGLIFNAKNVFVQLTADRPSNATKGIPPSKDFPEHQPIIWIWNPKTMMWSYWRVSFAQAKLIMRLKEKNIDLVNLSSQTIKLFFFAQILISKNQSLRNSSHSTTSLKKMKAHLKKEKFVVVRNLINPLQIAFFRNYTARLESEGYCHVDHLQVKDKRFSIHNDVLCEFIHKQSAALLRSLTSEKIFPSYSYLSIYKENAELKPHLDRDQCAWNCSLLLNQVPLVSLDQTWPLFIKTKRRTNEVRLGLGDMVLYSGTKLLHWRKVLPLGRRQSLVLFHYVPMEFTGSLF